MAHVEPDNFQFGINYRVPNLKYAADVVLEGPYKFNIGVLAAKSATFFGNAVQMVNGSAVTVSAANGNLLNGGIEPARYGRGIVLVASSTNTRTFVVTGYDYLGQLMVWSGALNSGTPVASAKAFKRITSIVIASASDTTTVNIGQTDVLGLPYRGSFAYGVAVDEGAPTGAGTFVAGLADASAPSATNADVRGTWTPNASDIPNGTKKLQLVYEPDREDLHGQAQYAG